MQPQNEFAQARPIPFGQSFHQVAALPPRQGLMAAVTAQTKRVLCAYEDNAFFVPERQQWEDGAGHGGSRFYATAQGTSKPSQTMLRH